MRGSLRVLGERSFLYLFLARTVSLFGSAIAVGVLPFAVLGMRGGSTTTLGLVLGARSLAQVVLLLFGGVLADRWPRFRLMAGSDLLAFGSQGLAAALFITGAAVPAEIIALSAVNGAANAVFLPASKGVVPQVVGGTRLQSANVALRLSRNSTSIVGTALGGVLVVTIGAGRALSVDAVTFAVVNGCFGAINVLGPLIAKQHMGGAPAWTGILAAQSAGLVAGSLVAARVRPKFPVRVAVTATLGFLPPFFLFAAGAPVWLVAASMMVNGVCVDIFEVLWDTALQTHIPGETLSRISSYDAVGSFALGPLCLMAVGPLSAAIGVTRTLFGAGALLTVITIATLAARSVRLLPATAPASTAAAPEPTA